MDGAGGATPLNPVVSTDSERLLEDTLVNSPDMLDEELRLVGRQVHTESGPLDLLGIDEHGRLTVIELKRATLQRDAVAQIIDYASYLDNLGDGELLEILTRSAKSHEIENFGEWYASEFDGKDLSSLRPVQITLVGLGVDPTANRMVRYLANGGMGISLLTFSGYHHNGQTLLARQVEVKAQEIVIENSQATRRPKGTLKEQLEQRLMEEREQWPEGHELFQTVRVMFQQKLPGFYESAASSKSDWAQYRLIYRPRSKWGRWHHKICAVQLVPWHQRVEAVFFPLALERCADEFAQIGEEFPFRTFPANKSERDAGVEWLMFDLETMADWELHQDKLTAVTQAVYEASADLRRE